MPATNRDQEILRMIARYGLITVPTLLGTLFSGLTVKAVERVLTRLLREERLISVPLVARKHYYILSSKSAREVGVPDERLTRPMGTQALLQNFAMLAYCALGDPRHERMTRREFSERFPQLTVRRLVSQSWRTRYYIDKAEACDGQARLALMIPDLGANQRRLLRKVRREIEERTAVSGDFRKMLEADLISVTVLTAFEERAERLKAVLAREPWHSRSVVVTGYDELLLDGGTPE